MLPKCGCNTKSWANPYGFSSSQREWHKRLLATIDNPRYNSSSLDPKALAATGNVYRIGRNLNLSMASVMLAYRETGDRDLVRHIDKIMNIEGTPIAGPFVM